MELSERERISPEKAIEILHRDGITVSLQEAKITLDFFYQIAQIVVEEYLSKQL
jgi:hypothetical protein